MHFKCICEGRRAHISSEKNFRWERLFREKGVDSSTSQVILCGGNFNQQMRAACFWGLDKRRGNQATSTCINSFICIELCFNWLSNLLENNILDSLHHTSSLCEIYGNSNRNSLLLHMTEHLIKIIET